LIPPPVLPGVPSSSFACLPLPLRQLSWRTPIGAGSSILDAYPNRVLDQTVNPEERSQPETELAGLVTPGRLVPVKLDQEIVFHPGMQVDANVR
jgi:hypothetical protein